jgi:hypothetical protein
MELLENTHVKNIQNILEIVGERIEGNLVCDKIPSNYIIHETIDKIRNLQYLCKGKKKICEIGINACHSLLIMLLENPDADYLLFDLNNHRYTEPCLKYIRNSFPNTKISVVYGNSIETITKYVMDHVDELNTYDLCHIDGGHTEDIFSVDYNNIKQLSKENSIVIFDDYDYGPIRDFVDKKVSNNEIIEYSDVGIKKTDRHFVYYYSREARFQ